MPRLLDLVVIHVRLWVVYELQLRCFLGCLWVPTVKFFTKIQGCPWVSKWDRSLWSLLVHHVVLEIRGWYIIHSRISTWSCHALAFILTCLLCLCALNFVDLTWVVHNSHNLIIFSSYTLIATDEISFKLLDSRHDSFQPRRCMWMLHTSHNWDYSSCTWIATGKWIPIVSNVVLGVGVTCGLQLTFPNSTSVATTIFSATQGLQLRKSPSTFH
jgi:hypothetical protein